MKLLTAKPIHNDDTQDADDDDGGEDMEWREAGIFIQVHEGGFTLSRMDHRAHDCKGGTLKDATHFY